MLNLIKQHQKLRNVFPLLGYQKLLIEPVRACVSYANRSSEVKFYGNVQSRGLLVSDAPYRTIISRQKSKSKAKRANDRRREQEEDSDDEDYESDEDEGNLEDGSTIKTYQMNSLRVDTVLKQSFNLKRKKVEESFYNNKIRLNDRVVLKKSFQVYEGDVLDLIKGSKQNPKLVEVGRVEILKVSESDVDEDKVSVKLKRFKSLVISNYPNGDPWKEAESEPEC